jgi:hypothetical protein
MTIKNDSWDDSMEDPATVANRQAIITGVEKANERKGRVKHTRVEGGTQDGVKSGPTQPRVTNGKDGTNSAAVNPRAVRDAVKVTVQGQDNTKTYRSVASAFIVLGLPMASHIKFRLKLKNDRTAIFEHETVSYFFEIAE